MYRNQITRDTGRPRTGWVRIRARYGSTCIACLRPVQPGRYVRWNPGREGGTILHDRCRIGGEQVA